MALADDLTTVLRSAPDLSTSPGLAVGAAQSGDPGGNAQALAHAGNVQAIQGATTDLAQRHGGHSLLGTTMGWLDTGWRDARHALGDVVGAPLKLANAGLQEVQHQYRYAHDIVVRHGLGAGLLELGVLAAGGVAAVALAPETGGGSLGVFGAALGMASTATVATLGAETAGAIVARANPVYQDSWAKTTDGAAYRDPHSGLVVSPGRDLAGILGLKEHKGLDMFSAVSAITDGLFDIGADPLSHVLGAAKDVSIAARSGTLEVSTAELAAQQGVKASKVTRALARPEDIDRAFEQSRGFRNAVEDFQGLTSGQIIKRYPKFADLAERLGPEDTADGVLQVLRNALGAAEITGANPLMVSPLAPSRNIVTALGVKAKVALQEQVGPVKWAEAQLGKIAPDSRIAARADEEGLSAKIFRQLGNKIPVYTDTTTGMQVRGGFDIMSNDAGKVTFETGRMMGLPHAVAEDVATSLMSEPTEAGRRILYKNMVINAIKVHDPGEVLDADLMKQLGHQFDETMPEGIETGRNAKYAYDINGRDLSKIMAPDGSEFTAGTQASHLGMTAIPDYDVVRTLIRSKSNFNQILGKTDDFFASHFTQGIFKPLVLVQPGTGMRIAAGEAATTAARFGLRSYVGALVRDSILKSRGAMTMETDLSQGEIDHALGIIVRGRVDLAEEAESLAPKATAQASGPETWAQLSGPHAPGTPGMEVVDPFPELQGGGALSFDNPPAVRDVVYRDADGKVGGVLRFGAEDPAHPTNLQVYVRDDLRRQGIGSKLYEKATKAGYDVEGASGKGLGGYTEQGAAFARGRQALTAVEDPKAMSLLARSRKGAARLAGVTDEQLAMDAKYVDFHGGTRTPLALRAGHGVAEDIVGKQAQAVDALHTAFQEIPKGMHVGDTFASYGNVDPQQSYHWQAWLRSLSKDEATQKAAKAYLGELKVGGTVDSATELASKAAKEHWDAQPQEVLDRFQRSQMTAVPGADPHTEWGHVITEALKGATHTPAEQGAVPNLDLLKAIASGKIVKRQLLEEIPNAERPLMVPGRELVPDLGGTTQKIANWGHRRFIEPIVNSFARDPAYRLEWDKQFAAFKPAVEAGELHESEAMQFASQRAASQMRQYIHNPMERALFSKNVTNWIPFYFAQEQAYRRAGRLLLEDPGAFRRYQLAMSALHDVAHPLPGSDGQAGQTSIMMPGTGFLGKYVPGAMNLLGFHTLGTVPVGFAGSLQSLQTVSPLVEDPAANFGPLAVFTGKTIAHIFPESTGFIDKVIGPEAAAGTAWDTLIPNTTLRRVWAAQRMDSRPNQAAMMNIIQLEAYKQEQAEAKWIADGQKGPKPQIIPGADASAMEKQQFLDRVKNHTRILDFVKAAIGFVSPLSPQYKFGDAQISDDLRKAITAKGGSLSQGVSDFLEQHPDATPYTVFQSEASDGSPIQSTHPAQQWIDANIDTIRKYPAAAYYLVPQSKDKFDSAVYNEQLAMGLRRKRTPEEFLQQVYIAQGNHDFYSQDRPAYNQALLAAKGNKPETAQIKANWKAYVAAKSTANPVWADDYMSPDRQNAQKLGLTQLQQMFSDGAAPAGPQTAAVKGLLDDFDTYQAASLPGRRDPVAVAHRRTLDIRWDQYLDGLVTAHPELSPVVNRLFRTMSEADRIMAGIGGTGA